MNKQRMFYWRSSGGSEPLDGVGNMSKTDILRGIITEKLSTAAREILAVVERTVADYEQEASGFRQQIEQQRRQLEVLQPHVQLNRVSAVPDLHGHEVVVVSEEHEEVTPQKDVAASGNLDFVWYEDDDEDVVDADEEVEQLVVQPKMSSREKRDDLKDPDYEISSRVRSHRRPGRLRGSRTPRGPGRPRISDVSDHLDLRVRLLEDCEIEVLSNNVFKNSSVQDLRCRRGLQESEFLELLKSSFPQLAAGEPFDLFITDNRRRLHPLRVKTLTPDEVHRAIRLNGKSALYIRLKTGEGPGSRCEDACPQEQEDKVRLDSATSTGQTEVHSGSVKRRRGRPRLGEEPTHHVLRMCMLEDSPSSVPPETVFQRSSVQDLMCPRTLQEADFMDLLRSTFPQLAGEDKKFNIYKSDRSRKLQRIKVETMTPDEIYRSLRSFGITKTLLYIKLKTQEDEETEEELNLPTINEALSSDAVMVQGEAGLRSSPVRHADGTTRGSTSRQPDLNPEEDAAGSDEDPCNDTDDDWKPDPEDEKPRKAQKWGPRSSVEKRKTPCKVCGVSYSFQGSLIRHAWSHKDEAHSVCGVCGESFASSEELSKHLKSYQKTHDCSYCGKAFFTVTGLNNHTTMHTGNRPYKCDVCNKTFVSISALGIHRWIHESDRPYKCDICPKTFGLMAQLRAHRKAHHLTRDKFQCHICGRCVYDLKSLTRHKMTHSGERRYGCEVCGKRFKLPSSLKSHEKTHTERERPFLCHICCKTFLTNSTLMAHMKTHSGERPFVCNVCGKGFLFNGELKNHSRVHTGEAPYGCSQCGRFFKLKSTLNTHIRSHLGIKRYVCSVCGKACSRQEHLTVHMRTHNGERPYKCTLCDKAFTQGHCLKTHMKSHHNEDKAFQEPSTS
ncbi:zinc finger protein 777-like [Melanotaenia boesemani]|uniref:zinc finger protein 777-like n=1 Tax=Melanotaenia boesemani TaxID=1250792 RepID=UPI001C055665|nr:zinc finger protein 777-like [Melanotaenia boesemani]